MVQAAAAEPAFLTGPAIKAALPGSVLKLDTPLGTVVPITFGGDGYMTGDAGQLASMLGSQKDRGRWWVAEDKVCYKWFRWFDAEQHCLAIKREGPRVFWTQDSGETGTATLEEHQEHQEHQEHRKPAEIALATPERPQSRLDNESADRSLDVQRLKPAAEAMNVTTAIKQPVLVKLPTPALRPQKRTIAVTTAVMPPAADARQDTERDSEIR